MLRKKAERKPAQVDAIMNIAETALLMVFRTRLLSGRFGRRLKHPKVYFQRIFFPRGIRPVLPFSVFVLSRFVFSFPRAQN